MNQLSLFDDGETTAAQATQVIEQPITPVVTITLPTTQRERPTPRRRRGEMRTIRRDGKWWIINIPVPDVTENGPYDRRDDADSDLDGLRKFFDRNPEYAEPSEAA